MPDVNLNNGGIAVVLTAGVGFVQDYAKDARVKFIDCLNTPGAQLESEVPANTKIIIYYVKVPHYHSMWAVSYCKRKGIPYISRDNANAIDQYLKSITKTDKPEVTQEEAEETRTKGKLNALIPFIDLTRSNAENGKALFRKAMELNIKTTLGSVIQLVAKHRNQTRGGTVPKSARPKLDVSVEMLDDAIKGLTDMREFLIATVEENRLLKARYDKLKKALDD